MNLGIGNKVALVTACSGGLGAAVCHQLAEEGCELILFSRNLDKLNALSSELQATHKVRVHVVSGDMTSEADLLKLKSFLLEKFGGLDILILNTGRPPLKMKTVLEENDMTRWQNAHDTQLWAPIMLTQHIVPLLIGRENPRIVAVTSATVKQPMKNHALSTVFRAGVAGLMRHLANELAQHGITVNMVLPASIATPALTGSYDMSERITQLPLKRLGSPKELATAVAFFCSKDAGFITGASLQVDGGMVGALQ